MLRAAQDDPHATIEPVTIDSSTSASRAVALLGALDQHGGLASNRYAVERTLGEGGMGVVYLATQLALGRKVALKTVRDEATSDRSVTKLLQEAWLTGALEHPNIVPVYDVALDAKGNPLMVLKRIEGRTWGDLLTDPEQVERRFGVRDTLEWHLRTLMQVCNAVHFAHSRGVVHRDLKPENVMIGEFGEVYVVDWGIAVSLKDDLGGRLPLASASAGMAGTPCYMAPEMLSTDAGAVTERTDVYLLGAILHEILTGDAPHDGRELAEILRSVMRSDVELPESAPAELAAICRRALARDPGARFESAEALRLAIQDYLAHASSTALAREAERALAALVEGAAVTAADDAHRARLYDRLGECRFGFRAALQAWPENEPARQCLSHALEHMIAFELRRGDAQAAAVLLRELANPPESLQRRVTREVERKAAEERRLRALARAMDPNAGRATKLVAGIRASCPSGSAARAPARWSRGSGRRGSTRPGSTPSSPASGARTSGTLGPASGCCAAGAFARASSSSCPCATSPPAAFRWRSRCSTCSRARRACSIAASSRRRYRPAALCPSCSSRPGTRAGRCSTAGSSTARGSRGRPARAACCTITWRRVRPGAARVTRACCRRGAPGWSRWCSTACPGRGRFACTRACERCKPPAGRRGEPWIDPFRTV